jgi:hypothetical protein
MKSWPPSTSLNRAKLPCSLSCDEPKVSPEVKIIDKFTFDKPSNIASKSTVVYDPKPIAYKAVRVSDGSRMLGIWTGTKWWSTKGEIKPVKWELEERKKKTEKLHKAIPKD